MNRPGENDPCARCGKPYSAHILETDPPQHADCKGFQGPERYDEKNPLHKALADLALRGGVDETVVKVLKLFDERYERRHVIREPTPGCRWGVYCIPINRSASDRTRAGWTTGTCLSEGATIEEATSQGLRLDVEQRRASLPRWSHEVREVLPDGTPGAFGPSLTVAAVEASEAGEPPRGSRLWRCEQELKRTRERMVDAERWRSEVTRAVQGLYAREADGYYRVAKGTLDSLFAIFQPGTESVAPKLSVREAARRAQPIDGADAQALEGALGQAERDLWEMKVKYEEQFTRAKHSKRGRPPKKVESRS